MDQMNVNFDDSFGLFFLKKHKTDYLEFFFNTFVMRNTKQK